MIQFLQPLDGLFTAVVALSTLFYAGLTAWLVIETRKLRKVQTEPKIVAYVDIIDGWLHFPRLYIENVGAGPAYNIKFSIKTDDENEGGKLLIEDFSSPRFLVDGLEYLGPNQKRRSNVSEFLKDTEKKLNAVFTVEIKYTNSTKKQYCDSYTIDISEFKGTIEVGTPPAQSVAKSLESIQKDITAFLRTFKS